jgi:hypothetical protein
MLGMEPPLLMIKVDAFYGKKCHHRRAQRTKLRTAGNISAARTMETFILKLLYRAAATSCTPESGLNYEAMKAMVQ